MNLIYNEKTVLDNFLTNNKCDIKQDMLIPILIKYYYMNGIKDKLMLREKILEDLYKLDTTNVRSAWSNKVDKTIKELTKSLKRNKDSLELIEIENIKIYEEELEIIETVKEHKLKKFLFVLLVWSKLYERFNRATIRENPRDLLLLAKCRVENKESRNLMLYELKETGLLWSKQENGIYKIRINYKKEEGKLAFVVNDFENAIYPYLNYLGENWKQCECEGCNKWFKQRSKKPQRYCVSCAKEKQKELQRKCMQKLRNKS